MALSVTSLTSCSAATISTFFSGSTSIWVNQGESKVTCKKVDIHPEPFQDAKVYCNGDLIMTTDGTQEEYEVDVWSRNHPFYPGKEVCLASGRRQSGEVEATLWRLYWYSRDSHSATK